jgi:hypothetical protein
VTASNSNKRPPGTFSPGDTHEDARTPFSHLREAHVDDAPYWFVFSITNDDDEGPVLLQVSY